MYLTRSEGKKPTKPQATRGMASGKFQKEIRVLDKQFKVLNKEEKKLDLEIEKLNLEKKVLEIKLNGGPPPKEEVSAIP